MAHAAELDIDADFGRARCRATELPLFELGLFVVGCQGDGAGAILDRRHGLGFVVCLLACLLLRGFCFRALCVCVFMFTSSSSPWILVGIKTIAQLPKESSDDVFCSPSLFFSTVTDRIESCSTKAGKRKSALAARVATVGLVKDVYNSMSSELPFYLYFSRYGCPQQEVPTLRIIISPSICSVGVRATDSRATREASLLHRADTLERKKCERIQLENSNMSSI
jgi:hypothetical protein